LKKRNFFIGATTLTVLSVIWILLTPTIFPRVEGAAQSTAAHPGFTAPDFTLSTPQDQTLSLADFRGQPVLVFFWASWCSVCKATMPGLQAVYQDYQNKGFELLAINTTYQDTLSTAINYYNTQGYSFPFLLDESGSVSKDYQLHALPTSVMIDPQGTITDVIIGSGMSEGFLRSLLDNMLAERE